MLASAASAYSKTDQIFVPSPDSWSLGLLRAKNLIDLAEGRYEMRRILGPEHISDRAATSVADPFILHHSGMTHLFFEVFDKTHNRGVIGHAESADLFNWNYTGVVLEERFHLSYPFVFTWKNETYMVPESKAARDVRLYRAVSFPHVWRLEKILLRGRYVDSTLFEKDGTWWMFTAWRGYNLRLFHSESPLDPWKRHRLPFVHLLNKKLSRPGGRVIQDGDALIRFTQDNSLRYGHQIRACTIISLSQNDYCERELTKEPLLTPGRSEWCAHRIHHIDPWQGPDGSWLAVVDGCTNP